MGNVVVTQYFKQHLGATITSSLSCLHETQFAVVAGILSLSLSLTVLL